MPIGVDDEGRVVVGVCSARAGPGARCRAPPLARAAAWKASTASGSGATKAMWSGLAGSPRRAPGPRRRAAPGPRRAPTTPAVRVRRSPRPPTAPRPPGRTPGSAEVGDPDDYVIDKGGRAGHRRTVLPGRLRVKRETHAWGAPISTRPRRASYKPLERSSENAVHPKFRTSENNPSTHFG